jgi:hypothetical protein
MPTMTPGEAATELLTKAKGTSGKLVVEQENENYENDADENSITGQDVILTQNGDTLLLSQIEKNPVTQKRRNPGRFAKSAQETIQESQNDGNASDTNHTGSNRLKNKGTKSPQKRTTTQKDSGNKTNPNVVNATETILKDGNASDTNHTGYNRLKNKGTKSPQKPTSTQEDSGNKTNPNVVKATETNHTDSSRRKNKSPKSPQKDPKRPLAITDVPALPKTKDKTRKTKNSVDGDFPESDQAIFHPHPHLAPHPQP